MREREEMLVDWYAEDAKGCLPPDILRLEGRLSCGLSKIGGWMGAALQLDRLSSPPV